MVEKRNGLRAELYRLRAREEEILGQLDEYDVDNPEELKDKYGERLAYLGLGYLNPNADYGFMVEEEGNFVHNLEPKIIAKHLASEVIKSLDAQTKEERESWLAKFFTNLKRADR